MYNFDFKGKKLLILAGAGPHTKVVEAAKEMGITTIVADYLPDSPAKRIADITLSNNINDIEALIAYGKKEQIDGVLGFCIDPTQRPAQQIAEGLQLPTFGTWEQTVALTDKTAFKQLCRANHVDTIPTYCEADITAKTLSFPVLVKPTDSRGSRGVTICHSYKDLPDALITAKAESSTGEAIIEKYMAAHQDLSISYLVKDGNPMLVSLGDRYPGRKEDNLNRQLACTIQPSRYLSMYLANVNERVIQMIQALGIQNGPVFMQGFVDGDTVRMYDPGIRFPGNEYERIHAQATGCNLMKSVISYIIGGEIDDYNGKAASSYDLNGLCAIQYMINVGPGKIKTFEGLEEIAALPFVIDVQQRHFIGDIIENTGDIKHRAGEISILIEPDVAKMKAAICTVQSKLRILNTEGQNMLISPFPAESLDALYAD